MTTTTTLSDADRAVIARQVERVCSAGPDPTDVEALTGLLDLLEDFASNEQRARYLLSSNWLRDRGAIAAARIDLAAALAPYRGALPRSRR